MGKTNNPHKQAILVPQDQLAFWKDKKAITVPNIDGELFELAFDFLVYGEAELWIDAYVLCDTYQFGIIFHTHPESELLETIKLQPHPMLIVDPRHQQAPYWVHLNSTFINALLNNA